MILKKEHVGKLLNLQYQSIIHIQENEFSAGDILILFNNNQNSSTIQSDILKTYKSGSSTFCNSVEVPPMCLVNAVFVDKDTVVITRGT